MIDRRVLLSICILGALTSPAWSQAQDKKNTITQQLYRKDPADFSFYCNFANKKFTASFRTEIKITSYFYLSEIIPNQTVVLENESSDRIGAITRCYETWLPRIKDLTIAHLIAIKRDLERNLGDDSLMLYEKRDTREKRALYEEKERKMQKNKRLLSDVSALLKQLQNSGNP